MAMRRRSSLNETSSIGGGGAAFSVSSVPSTQSLKVSDVNRSRPSQPSALQKTVAPVVRMSSSIMYDTSDTAKASAALSIGRESRELASRMHVDLAHIRSSVDLQTQTDRALVMCADRHFHATAKMWLHASSASPTTAAPAAAFHFVPISTAPLLSLRLQEGRTLFTHHSHRGRTLARGLPVHRRATSADGGGVVEHDDIVQRYHPADPWGASDDDTMGGYLPAASKPLGPRPKSIPLPRWNVSSKPSPETIADPAPLSVEEPTVEWIAKRRAAKRSSSADSAKGGRETVATQQLRRLRFEDPDGVVRVGGHAANIGRPLSSSDGPRRNHALRQQPVRSGMADESLERVYAPTTFGQSSTGLWSQVSEEKVRELAPAYRTNPRIAGPSSRDAAAATESKAYFPGIGDVGSKAIGLQMPARKMPDDPDAASGSLHGMSRDESYVRKQLHAMNINVEGGTSSNAVMDHPLWSGVVLCRLVNVIVRQCLPRQQLKEIPIRTHGGMTYHDVKENYVNALTRVREFHPPSGLDPIPPGLLYLDPREVLSGESHATLWALMAKLLETFVLKTADRSHHASGGASPQVPVLGRYCDVYSARNMTRLEESVCQFLFGIGVLVEPLKHAIPADDDPSAAMLPGALAAHFLPEKRSRWHPRRTPLTSLSVASVFPYLCNGTALIDVVCHVLDVDIPVHRNPRVRSLCLGNIRRAQDELQKHYPSRISNLFLCDPIPIFEGDKAFILLMLEDVMRLASKAAPRKVLPAVDQAPFLLPEKWTAGVTGGSQTSTAPLQTALGDASATFSAGMANASYAAQFVQPERQAFVADDGDAAAAAPHHWTLAELAVQREDSIDSLTPPPRHRDPSAFMHPQPHPFTTSKANPPPTHIKLRTMGVTTTAPSSGRSIVPSDESPEELYDDAPEPPALLPRHLEYLTAMKVEERELAMLAEWLCQKLGRAYRYQAADASFEVNTKDLRLTHPCLLFSDGVVLCHLVRILSYHKCPQLDNVQKAPKTTAAKRNNIKKVLEYLRLERKTLVDYVFLEDVIVTGDLRAIVLVTRALRASYKNHISSTK